MTPDTDSASLRRCAPAVSDIPALSLPPLRRRTLPNGMTLHIYDGCDSAVNQLTVVTPGGEAEAPDASTAPLLGIMKREGSRLYSGEEISSTLDFCGSWLAVSPSSHHIRHTLLSLNKCIDRVLPPFADLVFNPVVPEDVLAIRRESLANNLEMSMADVNYLAHCRCDELIMGPHHRLARTDTPAHIRSLDAESLLAFHAMSANPALTHIYLAGDITPEVEESVAHCFGMIDSAPTGAPAMIEPFSPQPAGRYERIPLPGAMQSAVAMSLPAVPRTHPDYHLLHIAVSALGGYFGSRLMLNIREEKGLTYGISAQLLGYIDDAHIRISAETDPRNTDMLIDEVRRELADLAVNPPQGDELKRLRQSLISSLSATLDSPFNIVKYHITGLISGLPDGYFDRQMQQLAAITPEAIAETARRYLDPDALRIAVAG